MVYCYSFLVLEVLNPLCFTPQGSRQVFKCEICHTVVVVNVSGGGDLVCCGEPMHLESE